MNESRPIPGYGTPQRPSVHYPHGAPTVPARPAEPTISVKEAARRLSVSKMTLYRMIHAKEFPAIQVRGCYSIPARVVDGIVREAERSGSIVDAMEWARRHR